MELQVVMKLSKIPEGAVVRKLTGIQRLRLYHQIKIYGEEGLVKTIKAEDGKVFLISTGDSSSINTHSNEKEVVWITDRGDLDRYLNKHDTLNE